MALNNTTVLLMGLSLAIISVLAESNSCQCKPGRQVCSDGVQNKDINAREYETHNERGLYGECLPEVAANTVQCFRWKTRACMNVQDTCEYWNINLNGAIMPPDGQSAKSLFSPRYNRLVKDDVQKFGHHVFCMYNVSLSCPSNNVIIESTAKTNWPKHQNTDCHDSNTCENYVAFYTDRNSNKITHQFYGQKDYSTTLDSNSFLAVMWTNKELNYGIFEFRATCNTQQQLPSTTLAGEEGPELEGSGNENILSAQEA